MKFRSRTDWEFVQALVKKDVLTIKKIVESDDFDIEDYICLPSINEEEDIFEDDFEYEVSVESLDADILTFIDQLGGEHNHTPLTLACYADSLELVKLLVGADINTTYECGRSILPLDIAISNNNTNLALFLLRQGADPELKSTDGCCDSWDSIQTAIRQKNEEVLDFMVIHNEIELAPYIDELALYGLNRYIKAVVKNWQCRINNTLHTAEQAKNEEIINLMLEIGAGSHSAGYSGVSKVSDFLEAKVSDSGGSFHDKFKLSDSYILQASSIPD